MIANVGPSVMPLTAGLGRRSRRAVTGSGALLPAGLLALALHDGAVLGCHPLDTPFNDWASNFALLPIGIGFSAAGDLYDTLALENTATIPSPAPSDALYLLFYPLAYAMIVGLVGQHVRGVHASVWLDGAIGGLTLAAVGSALVLDPVINATHGTLASVATNLAYPLGDLLLIVFVFGVFALSGLRPGRAWLLILLGFSVPAVADSIYLFRVAEGTYQAGTVLDALWPLGLSLLAFAAWPTPRRHAQARFAGVAMMVIPCLFGAIALFLLVRADYVHLGVIPETLARLALRLGMLPFAPPH